MGTKAFGIASTITFIITSAACYQGAMRGMPWLGLAVFLLELLALLPIMMGKRQRIVIALAIGLTGLILDTILITARVYSVESPARWILPAPICPEWVLALWLNFGLIMPNYLSMLRRRHIISGLIGFGYAFMVYGGAAKNKIITMPAFGMSGVTVIAIIWAILIPVMYVYVDRFYQKLMSHKEG